MNIAGQTVVVVDHSTDWAAILLGALGALLAITSLLWQAWSFFRSGSRVRVKIQQGGRGATGAVVFDMSESTMSMEEQIAMLVAQGYVDPILAVTAYNTGRSATSIVNCEVVFSDGGALRTIDNRGEPFPFRLEGESEQAWYFDARPVAAYSKASSAESLTARGRVRLGSQKVRLSDTQIHV